MTTITHRLLGKLHCSVTVYVHQCGDTLRALRIPVLQEVPAFEDQKGYRFAVATCGCGKTLDFVSTNFQEIEVLERVP